MESNYTFNIIVKLIRSVILDLNVSDIVVKDFELLHSMAVKHNVLNIVCEGLYKNSIEIPDKLKKIYQMDIMKGVLLSENQMLAVKQILKAFKDKKIKCMPMKGILLKPIYPKPELRKMSDVDILIDYEQCNEIRKIMTYLGYKEGIESDHEWIWEKPPFVHVELHKKLIPSYNEDMYSYYKNIWDVTNVSNNCETEYAMKAEDFYIYIFTHYAKHYREGGIGISHVMDLWVYKLNFKDLDYSYINKEIKELGLNEFYDNTLRMIEFLFENKKTDAIVELMVNYIAQSGAYGTEQSFQISNAAKMYESSGSIDKTRKRIYIKRLFIPYETMCRLYPVLKKCKYLLPVFYVYRIINTLVFKRKKIAYVKEMLDNTTGENIISFKESLNIVGLNYKLK